MRRRCIIPGNWRSASCIRNVKIQGELTWHWHTPGTGEFFLFLDGQLTIQKQDRNVVLAPRELFVVPAASSTVRRPIPKPRRCCSSRARSSTPVMLTEN